MSYESTILAGGPALYVPFTESSGTTFADLTGNGHTVTLDPSLAAGVISAGVAAAPLAGETALLVGDGTAGAIRLAIASPASIPCYGAFTVQYWVQYADLGGYPGGNAPLSIAQATLHGPPLDQNPYATFVAGLQTVVSVQPGWFQNNLLVAQYGGDGVEVQSPLQSVFPLCWHRWTVTWDGSTLALYRDTDVLTFSLDFGSLTTFNASFTPTDGSLFSFGPPSGGSLLPAAIFAIGHLAIYGRALSVDELAATYAAAVPRGDADCFAPPPPPPPPPDWVRLRHSSGQGYWQSNGDTIEEWAGGARRLLLPLPTLSVTPDLLVGQDPATGVPAYCPPPTAVVQYIHQDVGGAGSDPGTGTDQQHMCAVADACANHLASIYTQLHDQVLPLVEAAGFILVGAAVAFLVTSPAVLLIFGPIATLDAFVFTTGLRLIAEAMLGATFDALPTTAVADMRCALYRHLSVTGGQIVIDATVLTNWKTALASMGSSYSVGMGDAFGAIVDIQGQQTWARIAYAAAANSLDDCASCP